MNSEIMLVYAYKKLLNTVGKCSTNISDSMVL